MPAHRSDLVLLLMRAASASAEQINDAVTAGGFADIRPAHGLVFVRVSAGGATVTEIAGFLGITKQSAAVIVEHLVANGYLQRTAHPADRRATLLTMTAKATRVTAAAERAALEQWHALRRTHGAAAMDTVAAVLADIGARGAPHPVW